MNTVNDSNLGAASDPTYVGVDNHRLVVTTKARNFGTFACTVSGDYTPLPWNKATSFRITNLSGKTIGARPRHITSVVDDFEDGSFPEWTGSITSDSSLGEGLVGAEITSTAHRPLGNQVMLDGTEVDVTIALPHSDYSITISILDDVSRIGMDGAGQVTLTPQNTQSNTKVKVTFRLNPSVNTFDVFLESESGEYEQLVTGDPGVFGSNNMIGSIIHFDVGSQNLKVDPIILKQKTNYSVEHIGHGGSFVYPCNENTAEYELINLGSDAGNYTDTDPVSISGFFAL